MVRLRNRRLIAEFQDKFFQKIYLSSTSFGVFDLGSEKVIILRIRFCKVVGWFVGDPKIEYYKRERGKLENKLSGVLGCPVTVSVYFS